MSKTLLNTLLHAFGGEDVIEFLPLSNRLDPFTSFEFSNYFNSDNYSEFILRDFNYFVGDEISVKVYSDEIPEVLFKNYLTVITLIDI